jgi:sulfotransferase
MKAYHFLAGLPRSGNTLLSALLNQNPDIYCSPLSPLNSFYWDLAESANKNEHVLRNNDGNKIDNILKNFMQEYYKDVDKPVIIDREKAWATPSNFLIIKNFITPKPKIIFTVRPIIDILTSFITILPEHSYIDIEMESSGWWYKDYLTKNDNRCDYLMRPFGQIDKSLLSINEILKPENNKTFCLINYEEIINAPQDTMDKICKFLKLPNYKHDFNNIVKLGVDNDEIVGHPANMHEIRPQLKKVSKDPKKVLSEYVINKYSNIGWEA